MLRHQETLAWNGPHLMLFLTVMLMHQVILNNIRIPNLSTASILRPLMQIGKVR